MCISPVPFGVLVCSLYKSIKSLDIGTKFMDLKRGQDEPGVPVRTWTPSTLETKAGGVELEPPGESSS